VQIATENNTEESKTPSQTAVEVEILKKGRQILQRN
jgi:hypothetical protein